MTKVLSCKKVGKAVAFILGHNRGKMQRNRFRVSCMAHSGQCKETLTMIQKVKFCWCNKEMQESKKEVSRTKSGQRTQRSRNKRVY